METAATEVYATVEGVVGRQAGAASTADATGAPHGAPSVRQWQLINATTRRVFPDNDAPVRSYGADVELFQLQGAAKGGAARAAAEAKQPVKAEGLTSDEATAQVIVEPSTAIMGRSNAVVVVNKATTLTQVMNAPAARPVVCGKL